jgi:hypothetical protein
MSGRILTALLAIFDPLAKIASSKQLANKIQFVSELNVSSLPLPLRHQIINISVPICAGPSSIVINFQSSLGMTTTPAERWNPSHHSHQDDCECDLEPERATNPSQCNLNPISPRIGNQARSHFDEPHCCSQPPCQQVRAIEKTETKHQYRHEGCPGPKYMNACPIFQFGVAMQHRRSPIYRHLWLNL